MSQPAKLSTNGRSQAVCLFVPYHFDTKKVFIRRYLETGDAIRSHKPASWDDFFAALKGAEVPPDFLDQTERAEEPQDRDPFDGWRE
jgi:antitoxin VapB